MVKDYRSWLGRVRRRVLLLLLCVFFMPTLASAETAQCSAHRYTGTDWQKFWTADTGKVRSAREAQACVDKTEGDGGIGPYIDAIWPADLRKLARAIACHENGGSAKSAQYRYTKDSNGNRIQVPITNPQTACAFQIHTGNYAPKGVTGSPQWVQFGRKYNLCSTSDSNYVCATRFYEAAQSDGKICARAGYDTLMGHQKYQTGPSGEHNIMGALCGYSGPGPAKEFRYCGDCGLGIEFYAVKSWMEGKEPERTVHHNIDEENYGQVDMKIEGKTYTLFNCQDKSVTLAQGLAKAMKGFQYNVIASSDEVYKSTLKAQAAHPMRDTKGDISKKYCIEGVTKFFSAIQSLLSDMDGIINMIKSLIQSMLNQVCSAVASSINSLLSSICLPLPDLSFGFDFSGTTAGCNGLSLAKLISVQSGSVDLDKYFVGSTGSSSTGADDVLYPVNGLVTPGAAHFNGGSFVGWFRRKLNDSQSDTLFKY